MLAVPSAPARSTHGPALKIPPVRLTLAGPMDCSHGIELGSRARLGTRPSGTWVVYTHPVATAQPPGTAGGGLLREF